MVGTNPPYVSKEEEYLKFNKYLLKLLILSENRESDFMSVSSTEPDSGCR